MEHKERISGKSDYTLGKLFRLWKNGITSFSTKALGLSIYLGVGCAIAGFGYAIFIFIKNCSIQVC